MNKKRTRYYFEDKKRLINWEWVFVTGFGTAMSIIDILLFLYLLFTHISGMLALLFFMNFWVIIYATLYYQTEFYEEKTITRRYYLKEEKACE